MHCRAHQKRKTPNEIGNAFADREAKRAAEEDPVELHSLVPDREIQIDSEPRYLKEDQNLIKDLGGQVGEGGWVTTPQGQISYSHSSGNG